MLSFLYFFFMLIAFSSLLFYNGVTFNMLEGIFFNVGFILWWNQKIFFFFALSITMSIIMFSLYYMRQEEHLSFTSFLFIFFTFMIILVSSSNLFFTFLGWEGVGIMSFLLIGTFSSRDHAIFSSKKAIFYNRLGDFFFFILILQELMSQNMLIKTTSILEGIFSPEEEKKKFFFFLCCCLCIFVKSSQFFFNPWLTSAMEGPTPVSALLHSSTMVVAGVYFFFMFFHVINLSFSTIMFISWVSCFTNFLVSLAAFTHHDCKKIIALSTASQLSFMIFIICLGQSELGFFHLISHGFFKALLFLASGVLIHQNKSSQDLRKSSMTSMWSWYLKSVFFFSSMALMGLPFLGAFFSKHKIILLFLFGTFNSSAVIFYIISLTLTIGYSLRMLMFLFGTKFIWNQSLSSQSDFQKLFLIPLTWLLFLVFLAAWSISDIISNFQEIGVFSSQKFFTYAVLMIGILLMIVTTFMKKGYMLFNFFFISNWNRLMFFFISKSPASISSFFIENAALNFFFKLSSLKSSFLQSASKNSSSSSLLNFFVLIIIMLMAGSIYL
uniref:NADH:ubiquinone reductase (H(+)-translocating) n=1 Tax=Baltalimania ylvae TaxID=3341436 RepID=A0A1X9WDA0_9BILA|nr:NADH dehydrogenase subunit 5 [Archaphanostoma ylvae]ARS00895.1 NADH dehydrogenase subunit 5 [Archaphanostoma ylvae]